jgi:hypothetical protein
MDNEQGGLVSRDDYAHERFKVWFGHLLKNRASGIVHVALKHAAA